MFDTILNNLNTLQDEMVQMFKQQYEWGWLGKTNQESNLVLRGYVNTNALTPEGYKEITGEDYNETSLNKS